MGGAVEFEDDFAGGLIDMLDALDRRANPCRAGFGETAEGTAHAPPRIRCIGRDALEVLQQRVLRVPGAQDVPAATLGRFDDGFAVARIKAFVFGDAAKPLHAGDRGAVEEQGLALGQAHIEPVVVDPPLSRQALEARGFAGDPVQGGDCKEPEGRRQRLQAVLVPAAPVRGKSGDITFIRHDGGERRGSHGVSSSSPRTVFAVTGGRFDCSVCRGCGPPGGGHAANVCTLWGSGSRRTTREVVGLHPRKQSPSHALPQGDEKSDCYATARVDSGAVSHCRRL